MITSYTVLATYPDADRSPQLIEVTHSPARDRGDGVKITTEKWELRQGADPNAEILAWEVETAQKAAAKSGPVAVRVADRKAIAVSR